MRSLISKNSYCFKHFPELLSPVLESILLESSGNRLQFFYKTEVCFMANCNYRLWRV